jgi:hypothetical protein
MAAPARRRGAILNPLIDEKAGNFPFRIQE